MSYPSTPRTPNNTPNGTPRGTPYVNGIDGAPVPPLPPLTPTTSSSRDPEDPIMIVYPPRPDGVIPISHNAPPGYYRVVPYQDRVYRLADEGFLRRSLFGKEVLKVTETLVLEACRVGIGRVRLGELQDQVFRREDGGMENFDSADGVTMEDVQEEQPVVEEQNQVDKEALPESGMGATLDDTAEGGPSDISYVYSLEELRMLGMGKMKREEYMEFARRLREECYDRLPDEMKRGLD